MEGILFVLRTGGPWGSLDRTGIVSGSTAHDRFQEWVADDVFYRIWQQGLLTYDELQGIDWSWLSADGAQTKAPLGGEKKRGPTRRIAASAGPNVACSWTAAASSSA